MLPSLESKFPRFTRYIGIDYSGAQTPSSSLSGLRVYAANRTGAPEEVQPPSSSRKYWTRRGIAEWLVNRLSEATPTLVGIDHGFSFPLQYFDKYGLPLDWALFLDDFQRHWPTDEDIYVCFAIEGSAGNGSARSGNPRWRRLTELRHVQPNRCSSSKFKGKWRCPLTRASLGFGSSGSASKKTSTSGRSTVGAFRPVARSLLRSTLRSGTGLFQLRDEIHTSKMPLPPLDGCRRRILTAALRSTSTLPWSRMSARRLRLKDGFSAFLKFSFSAGYLLLWKPYPRFFECGHRSPLHNLVRG